MSPLEQLHADQHDDIELASDHALQAFLAETPIDIARLDLNPITAIESLHLNRIRSTPK